VAKIDYSAPQVRDVTDVSDIGSLFHPGPLEALEAESVNIDSSNLREEGLDLSVFAPSTVAERVYEGVQHKNSPRFVLDHTAGVWVTLDTVNSAFPVVFETGVITLQEGDALEIRATIHFVSDNATSAGVTDPGPYGLGPLTPVPKGPKPYNPFHDPSIFGLRIGMDYPTGVSAYLVDTERFLGGGFIPTINDTLPGDNAVAGRHGSLCVMTMVPSVDTLIEPPGAFVAGDYKFRLEYRTSVHEVCVRQIMFYIIKYPRAQTEF
tara:strand:- start:2540 stop:3331 length:792 start_codon:yes stop_codon:yes gene_type:complete